MTCLTFGLFIKFSFVFKILSTVFLYLSIFDKSKIKQVISQFGEKIKHLRETNGLLQRQVASELQIDTPMLSKIERGDRKAKKEQLLQFAKLYKADHNELLTLWLADQLYDVVKDEDMAFKAIDAAQKSLKSQKKRNQI
jgi:HTH-type transcriptional regulator, competence development regulator